MPSPTAIARRAAWAPYAAFTAFGVFWGAWGAALPVLRTRAGVSDGQLGTALLFIGLGALPAMALTGRALDRHGLRAAAHVLVALAGAGLVVAVSASGLALLVVGMLLVGAASGAADIAINTVAARAEHLTGEPLLTRSAGLFSVGVVVASLATGALLGAGLSVLGAFAAVAAVMTALAAVARVTTSSLQLPPEPAGADGPAAVVAATPRTAPRRSALRRLRRTSPLVVVGLVAALAFAVENAHQSWGAVMLTDVFAASPPLAAAAPAAFAAAAAVARLTLAPLSRSHPTAVLLGGGALAAAGSTVLATAPSVGAALVGLVLAAAGTATLFPTLLSRSLRDTDPAQHGRSTSAVAATAYLGFLLGPAYVGLIAEHTDLRGALIGVAALAAVFTAAAAPISSWAAGRAHAASRAAGPSSTTTSAAAQGG